MENLILIPIGMAIATFASLIGIGGGLIWAPYFILFQGFPPQKAIMFSFLIQFVGMGSATFSNIRQKYIFWKIVTRLLPLIAIGITAGAYLNQRVANPNLLKGILGVVSIAVSIFFTVQTEKYDTHMTVNPSTPPPLWLKIQSPFFGWICGLLSIGIGDFLIPIMRGKMKIPMKYTVGTNLFLNFSIAVMGSVFHLSFSEYRFSADMYKILLFSWIGVFIGGQLGPMLSNHFDDTRLKEVFIFILLLMGIHLIYKSL